MRFPFFVGLIALAAICACSAVVIPLSIASKSSNWFSAGFLKEVAKDNSENNVVVSPLSAYIILSLAAYGAKGNTAEQMASALLLPYSKTIGIISFRKLLDDLQQVDNVTLEVANKIYVAKDLKIKDEFKQLAVDPFRAEAAELDVTNPKEAANSINDWVAEKTHQKIKDLVQEDDIHALTRMILLNAIYFKANWYTKFDEKKTRNENFYAGKDSKVGVPTMRTVINTAYGVLPEIKARYVELPYENQDVVMIVVLPDEIDGLSGIEENLQMLHSSRLQSVKQLKEVHISLPKFKIENTIDLQKVVESLGMTDMFTDQADFTLIANEPLKVDKIAQKAYIEVNEMGTKAAVTTNVNIGSRSSGTRLEKVSFVVDRPFYFMVKTPEVILFQGHVTNPM